MIPHRLKHEWLASDAAARYAIAVGTILSIGELSRVRNPELSSPSASRLPVPSEIAPSNRGLPFAVLLRDDARGAEQPEELNTRT